MSFLSIAASMALEISFDEADELGSQLVEVTGKGMFHWSDEKGANGSPGILVASVPGTSHRMLYTQEQFEPDNGKIEASFHFLAEEFLETGTARIAVGISPDQQNLITNIRVQARLLKSEKSGVRFEIRGTHGAGPSRGEKLTDGVRLISGHWYKLSATFQRIPGKKAFSVDAFLEDITDSKLVASASEIRPDSESVMFNGDAALPVQVGFVVQLDGGGARAIDSIGVSQPRK